MSNPMRRSSLTGRFERAPSPASGSLGERSPRQAEPMRGPRPAVARAPLLPPKSWREHLVALERAGPGAREQVAAWRRVLRAWKSWRESTAPGERATAYGKLKRLLDGYLLRFSGAGAAPAQKSPPGAAPRPVEAPARARPSPAAKPGRERRRPAAVYDPEAEESEAVEEFLST